jgi:serine protease Do
MEVPPQRLASNPVTSLARSTARPSRILAPGTSAKLDVLHKGEWKTITVTLGKLPGELEANPDDKQSPESGSPHLGLTLAPADEVAGSGGKGVVVTGVDPEGPAERGFQSGDVILAVGCKTVDNPIEVRKALSDAKSQRKHNELLRVKTADK